MQLNERIRKNVGPVNTRIGHYCPGCDDIHYIPVERENAWGFNGDWENPTLNPSIKHTMRWKGEDRIKGIGFTTID